jgi:hypothetical protein
MKDFNDHVLSIEKCIHELDEFENFLLSKEELKEREDILPFFQSNLHLASFIGTCIPTIGNPDKIATEYDIFCDFTCDLAIGDSISKTFLLIEFEDAKKNSLFVTKKGKSTPEWAPRLEHGFSQIIDWFWKINTIENSHDYKYRFGSASDEVEIHGLLVIGRDQHLEAREKARLKWRQKHTIVHSKKISVMTFDQLARDLRYRLLRYPQAAKADHR